MGVVLVGEEPGSISSFVEDTPSSTITVSLSFFTTKKPHKLERRMANFSAGKLNPGATIITCGLHKPQATAACGDRCTER